MNSFSSCHITFQKDYVSVHEQLSHCTLVLSIFIYDFMSVGYLERMCDSIFISWEDKCSFNFLFLLRYFPFSEASLFSNDLSAPTVSLLLAEMGGSLHKARHHVTKAFLLLPLLLLSLALEGLRGLWCGAKGSSVGPWSSSNKS